MLTGQQIRMARSALKWSARELAERTGLAMKTIQRIEINNLLKEIDIEDLQLKAKANKEQNDNLHALVTKWNFITKEKNDV